LAFNPTATLTTVFNFVATFAGAGLLINLPSKAVAKVKTKVEAPVVNLSPTEL